MLRAAGGGLIGFLLSLLGAGGSILLLPLLVSGAALPSREAVPLSLLAVTLLALANLGPTYYGGSSRPDRRSCWACQPLRAAGSAAAG
ncbi:MAG: hypothetical protein ACKO5M_02035 [Vulcanococcus sp.]